MNEKSRNKAWELPGDFGDRLGVHQNNVAMVALAVLMDIRATLDQITMRMDAKEFLAKPPKCIATLPPSKTVGKPEGGRR